LEVPNLTDFSLVLRFFVEIIGKENVQVEQMPNSQSFYLLSPE
jgi:hypothetical protein